MGGLGIVVADDQPIRADAVGRALEVIGDAMRVHTPFSALSACERAAPDVVVLSPGVLETPGLDVVAHLRRVVPRASIVVFPFTPHDAQVVAGAVEAGVDGVVPAAVSADELVAAVRSVAGGQALPFPPSLVRALFPPNAGGKRLSPTERRILGHVRDRLSNPEIATVEILSLSTVKTHLERIYRKLSVQCRADAVEAAIDRGELTARSKGRQRASGHRFEAGEERFQRSDEAVA